jgi:micrococcal nuclease
LRYVYVGDVFVNLELVRLGVAKVSTWPPDVKYVDVFTAAQQEAQAAGRGLWSATPTPEAAPTQPPQPTAPPAAAPANVTIDTIFFNGAAGRNEPDEYVELRNAGAVAVQLAGWRLHDEGVKHSYIFPSFELQPGQACRVYTNEDHPEWCGFNFGNTGSAIWNNGGDCAYLYGAQGEEVARYCY